MKTINYKKLNNQKGDLVYINGIEGLFIAKGPKGYVLFQPGNGWGSTFDGIKGAYVHAPNRGMCYVGGKADTLREAGVVTKKKSKSRK